MRRIALLGAVVRRHPLIALIAVLVLVAGVGVAVTADSPDPGDDASANGSGPNATSTTSPYQGNDPETPTSTAGDTGDQHAPGPRASGTGSPSADGEANSNEEDEPPPLGRWESIPESPLGPLNNAASVWTGEEAVIVTPAGRAAGFDPSSRQWRDLPDLPSDYSDEDLNGASSRPHPLFWVGGVLIRVHSDGKLYRFEPDGAGDPAAGLWLPVPGHPLCCGDLVVTGDALWSFGTPHDGCRCEVISFDPTTNAWASHPPTPRAVHGRVHWTPAGFVSWVSAGSTDAGAGLFYEPVTGDAEELPRYPGDQSVVSVLAGGRVVKWLIGDPEQGEHFAPEGFDFDVASRAWTPTPTAPSPFAGLWSCGCEHHDYAQAVPASGAAFAVGLFDDCGPGEVCGRSTVQRQLAARYDVPTRSWRMLPDMPLARRVEQTVVWTDHGLVVLGGIPPDGRRGPMGALEETPYADGVIWVP